MRLFLSPIVMIIWMEGDKIIYPSKFGITFVLYVQLFWVIRVVYLALEAIKQGFESGGNKAPAVVNALFGFSERLQKDKKTKMWFNIINFVWIFLIPHAYYGFVRGTLF